MCLIGNGREMLKGRGPKCQLYRLFAPRFPQPHDALSKMPAFDQIPLIGTCQST